MRNCFCFLLSIIACTPVFSQPSLATLAKNNKTQKQENVYSLQLASNTQGAVQFSSSSRLSSSGAKQWLFSSLGLRSGKDEFQKMEASTTYNADIEIVKYEQWYQGIKVEHGYANVMSQAGKVAAVQLEFYPLDENFVTTPVLSEEEAFQKAIAFVGATKYVWDDDQGNDPALKKPSGSLVIVEDYYGKKGRMDLAYKFQISAEQPFSHSYVYISATDGKVLLVDRIVKHFSPDINSASLREQNNIDKANTNKESLPFANAAGTAQTRYSGLQNIVTDDGSAVAGKPYRLRQVRNGHNIVTLNYQRKVQNSSNDAAAIDFADNDNNWTTAENKNNYDDAALDVQMAMQYISDYWKTIHNRNSWDNKGGEMRSYVHVRASSAAGYDNAFWGGAAMYYGDGSYYSTDGLGTVANSSGFKPLTSLDVSAHELGHAVCQSTANLVYQRESGGMNEGFSDIWAACVEHYSGLSKSFFLIGEEIDPAAGALRSMQSPKLFGDPDTYGGQYWIATSLSSCPVPIQGNDECGVHYNSGVLNHWFYLLTQGGNGTNDNGDAYSVTGLGFTKSEKIAFLTEQNLTPNANYAAARLASINAATVLYGACSNEVVQVTNAWFAAGVGASANCTPTIEFVKSRVTVSEGAGLAGSCNSTSAVFVPVKLGAAATQKTDVQFSFGGTAIPGVNYTVSSPVLSFNAGESGTKNLVITILDNASVEGPKTILLSYTVNGNGGNGIAGINNQVHTINITEDDVAPAAIKAAPVSTVTLVNENFESSAQGTVFPAGWSATLNYADNVSATNVWAIGPNAGAGINGNSAYISNTSGTSVNYAYSTSSSTDKLLRLPVLNTTGLTNLQLQFTYKVGGEVDLINPSNTDPDYWAALYDYGRVVYDVSGSGLPTNFSTLFNSAANDYFAFYGDGVTALHFAPFRLPSSMENKAAVYLGFRWYNDGAAGNGFPMAVDDIVITGRTIGSSIETATGQSNSVNIAAGTNDSYIASNSGNNLLVKLSNTSQAVACLTATLAQAGNGRTTINSSNGSFFRTQKIIQLIPAVVNTSITYKATFYFTAADLAGWSSAEIPLLKILKVKGGVDLAGTLTSSDAELVTPTFSDNSSNGYYSYTGNFTGFSRFMLVSPGFALPVNLLAFEAQPQKKTVLLSWSTATENNNRGFEVQRSVDGADYSSIGWVKGAGTTASKTSYVFTDNFVHSGVVYHYRLKQMDFENRASYSAIRQVRLAEESLRVTVSPNPVRNTLKIFVEGAGQRADISLVNAKGQTIAEWKNIDTRSVYQADVSRFSRGIYTVVVHLPNGDQTAKLLLQ